MVFRRLVIAVILTALLAGLSAASDQNSRDRKPAPPVVNLHGKAYMGFIDLSETPIAPALPAATEEGFLPTYIIFGQSGSTLYGGVVIPSESDNGSSPTAPQDIILKHYAIIEGQIKGKNISFTLDDIEDLQLEGPIKGKVLDGGNKIKLFIKTRLFGKIPLADIYICNQESRISGQYLGSGQIVGSSPPAVNNVMLGILVRGTKLDFTVFLYNPADPGEPYVLTGEAQYDPQTGSMTFNGNAQLGEPDVTGSIKNGVMALTMNFPNNTTASATLHFFSDSKKRNPRLKKPKPRSVAAGKVTKVRIKHRRALPGSLISVNQAAGGASSPASANVGVIRYEYLKKYFDVWLDAPANAKGKVRITLTGPDGKKASAKKQVKVK